MSVTHAIERFVQGASIRKHGTGGQRKAGEPPDFQQLDGGELAEAELVHVAQNQIAAPDFDDVLLANGVFLLGSN